MSNPTFNDILDTVLHKIYNIVNSQPRKNVTGVANGLAGVMKSLSQNHIIKESETTRTNVDSEVFEKMSKVEDIISKSSIAVSLDQYYVSQRAEVQNVRNAIKSITSSEKTDEIVNDIIGG